MPYPALFGLSVFSGFIAWTAVARYVFWPVLKDRPATDALRPILLLHGFRFLGLAFLVPGVVSPDLASAFAQPAAYGDFAAAILAWASLVFLGTRIGSLSTWVFNVFGAADLLFAFYRGNEIALADHPGRLGATFFIVTATVPLLMITHGLAFRILLRGSTAAESNLRLAGATR